MTLFTISESSRTIKIGYNISRMEKELKKLPEETKKLKYKLGKLKTLKIISLKVKDMKLNLIIPNNSENGRDIAIVKKPHKHLDKNPHEEIEP